MPLSNHRIDDAVFAKAQCCCDEAGSRYDAHTVLEPYAGKLAHTVLRGPRAERHWGYPLTRCRKGSAIGDTSRRRRSP